MGDQGFPGDTVDGSPSGGAGDTDSSRGLGGFHVLRST